MAYSRKKANTGLGGGGGEGGGYEVSRGIEEIGSRISRA